MLPQEHKAPAIIWRDQPIGYAEVLRRIAACADQLPKIDGAWSMSSS